MANDAEWPLVFRTGLANARSVENKTEGFLEVWIFCVCETRLSFYLTIAAIVISHGLWVEEEESRSFLKDILNASNCEWSTFKLGCSNTVLYGGLSPSEIQ